MRGPTLLVTGLLAMLGCCVEPCHGLRILALFPLNVKSQQTMSERLLRGLAAKGHQLDVYSPYPPEKPIANYKHHSLEGTLPSLADSLNYSAALELEAIDPAGLIDAMGNPACKLMELPMFEKLVMYPRREPRYDLVIVEVFLADCYLVWGRHLNVPMVGVMSATLIDWYYDALGNTINTAITSSYGASFSAPMDFRQRLQNTIYSSYVKYLFARAIRVQNDLVEKLFRSGYPDVNELRRDIDLLVANSHHSIDGIMPQAPAIVPVAGIHIDDEDTTELPQNIRQWLDDSKSGCVYVSLGSTFRLETLPLPVLRAMYKAFDNIRPVRFLLRVSDPKLLPEGLPSNVMVQSWFPQLRVLKHNNTRLFVTNGGLMSLYEAIYSAVPMVGIPIFGDQHSNVDKMSKKKILLPIHLEEIDEKKLTVAMKHVMYTSTFKQNAERLSKKFVDRPMKPLETAIYWVEYVARHGRKCLRSPLVDMPWWQTNLLDVYAFTFVLFLANYYLLRMLIKKICAMCCAKKRVIKRPPSKPESKKKR